MDTHHDNEGALRTVAQVAQLTGITVRTLHHYDQIGLLTPSARTDAEYRLYSRADITRLREILVWRRLDVSLAQIGALLDDPDIDRRAVLEQQRVLVGARIDELAALATALDHALDTTGGTDMATDQQIIDALDGFDPADHAAETRERWGHTDVYRQSAARTKQYGPADWRTIRAEAHDITEQLAALWREGCPADDDRAVERAEAWRVHISRWFYDCPPEYLRGLGEMYVADPRFTASYDGADGVRAGFAAWIRDVWIARADRS